MSVFRYVPFAAMLTVCGLLIFSPASANAQPSAFQGFETPADLACWSGDGTITQVPSGGGVLHVPSFDGNFHAEITNEDNAFQNPGFGDSKFTQFCLPPSGYQGDFSQTISTYIFANWPPAAQAGTPSFWIDEAPRDASGLTATGASSPFTAEHNFRLTATGSSVNVAADDGPTFATISQTGWYTFQMTFRKDPNPANPVISDLRVFDSTGNLVGSTTITAHAVGSAPPLLSGNLGGPSYLWYTVWQNGFANDRLAIDDARVSGTGTPPFPFPGSGANSFDLFFYWFFAS